MMPHYELNLIEIMGISGENPNEYQNHQRLGSKLLASGKNERPNLVSAVKNIHSARCFFDRTTNCVVKVYSESNISPLLQAICSIIETFDRR